MPKSENTRALKVLAKKHNFRAGIPATTLRNHLSGQPPSVFWLALYYLYGLSPEGWLTGPERRRLKKIANSIDKASKVKAETIQSK